MLGRVWKWMLGVGGKPSAARLAYEEALFAGWVPPTLAQPAAPVRAAAERLPDLVDSGAEAFLARVYAAQQA